MIISGSNWGPIKNCETQWAVYVIVTKPKQCVGIYLSVKSQYIGSWKTSDFTYLFQSENWSLLKTNSYCKEIKSSDDNNVGYYDMAGCVNACSALQANLFAKRCLSSNCSCYCQMSTINNRPCDCLPYAGYNLYQINKLNSQANYQCSKLNQFLSSYNRTLWFTLSLNANSILTDFQVHAGK